MPTAGAHSPRVSVLTAVYNGERYLGRALESVRRQTFSDFEHVIVDDASTDGSWPMLQAAAHADPRRLPERLSRNVGPAEALNRALARARGEYVAILDHDDECAPERLALQVAYLDAHPDVGVLGTFRRNTNENGVISEPDERDAESDLLKWRAYFGVPFIHSSFMMRADVLRAIGGYDAAQTTATDYDLLLRLSSVTAFAVLPQRLVTYRKSSTQLSVQQFGRQQGQVVMRLHAQLRMRLGIRADLSASTALFQAVRKKQLPPAAVASALALLDELVRRHVAVCRPTASATDGIHRFCAARCRDMEAAHQADPDSAQRCAAAARSYEDALLKAPALPHAENRG
jgi:Glycosyl transferase family 2